MAQGGFTEFDDSSTAVSATFINQGGTTAGAYGGVTVFEGTSHAGDSTIIANAGTNGGAGGAISFISDSFGDTAHIQLFGNGLLSLLGHGPPGVAIASLEGNGTVFMGSFDLIVGVTDQNCAFAGKIKDDGQLGVGPLRKVGNGTLILRGAGSYTGGTIVEGGGLEVSNQSGSATGTGLVRVRRGRLGGRGIISGPVSIGTGAGQKAVLSPGRSAVAPQTLTLQSTLTFRDGATYNCGLNSSTALADKVVANKVMIDAGVLCAFAEAGNAILSPGTVFTIIDNTSSESIDGTFSNLPDGGTITVGSNNFQANYEGGDGNDLTLTVVP